jgi:hypothetical protein
MYSIEDTNMITFKRLGHKGMIGNQLFQLSTLLTVGKSKNYKIGIPRSSGAVTNPILPNIHNCRCDNHNTYFHKLTDGFDLGLDDLTCDDDVQLEHEFRESTFSYDDSIKSVKDCTNLEGYFQTEKYFIENRNDLLKTFSFKPSVKNTVHRFLDEEGISTDFATVHVRRGDAFIHPEVFKLTSNYYNKLIDQLDTNQIVFVSDDIEFCQHQFPGFHYFNTQDTPFEDLYMLTLSKYNITANSTFSWWGAWLNQNNNVVFSPNPMTQWRVSNVDSQGRFYDMSDIIPNRWKVSHE